jgi:hypothetical protein
MLVAVGFSPFVVNSTVSYVILAIPVAVSSAPPVFALLLQPSPVLAGELAQGQPITPLAPGSQIDEPGVPQPAGLPHLAR